MSYKSPTVPSASILGKVSKREVSKREVSKREVDISRDLGVYIRGLIAG
jgi:hypothetical protein